MIGREDGRYLMVRRGPACHFDQLKWEFPGGKVDFGETLAGATMREVWEELGVVVEVVGTLATREIIGASSHWLGTSFICKLVSGNRFLKEVLTGKQVDLRWVTVDEMGELDLSIHAKGEYIMLKERLSRDC